jgi:hypothetical protein
MLACWIFFCMPGAIAYAATDVTRMWFTPAVVPENYTQPVRFEATVTGNPDGVVFEYDGVDRPMYDDGTYGDLAAHDGTWTILFQPAEILSKLTPNRVFRPIIGYCKPSGGGRYNIIAEVWTSDIGLSRVDRIDAGAQQTDYVVNFVATADELMSFDFGYWAQRFYAIFGDNFDFLNFVLVAGPRGNRGHATVRNDVGGIGVAPFDASASLGSKGRLKGFTDFPISSFFDAGDAAFSHETGHQWINFLRGTVFASAIPHWPKGDIAINEMGFSIGGTGGEGGRYYYTFTPEGQSGYRVGSGLDINQSIFNSMELYLMGLLPPEEVGRFFVLNDQSRNLVAGQVLTASEVTHVTVNDVIASAGPRLPASTVSQKIFRSAVMVISEQLLDAYGMSFYDWFARRAEATQQLPYASGLASGVGNPFHLATGGRGWMISRLRETAGTTPSKIYFPYFQGSSKRYTGLALANWGSTPADVLFTAFDDSGTRTATPAGISNPHMITIAPGAQIAMLAEQVFGLAVSDPRNGWIKAESSSSQVAGFFLDGDFDQTLLDGAVADSRTATSLYLTCARRVSGRRPGKNIKNLIDIINPGVAPAHLLFNLLDNNGASIDSASRTLLPGGRMAEDILNLFPGTSQPQADGYISLTSDAGVAGYQAIEGEAAVYALPAQTPSTATRLYSAQFASGGGGSIRYFTDLNLINLSAQTRRLSILLVGNNGIPIPGITNPVTIELTPGKQARTRGESLFGLPDPALAATLVEGSLVITADGPGVIGDVVFGDPVNERFLASLPLAGSPSSSFLFSQVAQGGGGAKPYWTGIAMYNPNTVDINVTLQVYSEKGIETGAATIRLAGGARVVGVLPQLVPAISAQLRGYVRVASDRGPVVAFELFGDQEVSFLAAVSPQSINPQY